jgi:hypothetical protein
MAPIWYGFYGKAEVVSRRRPAISIGVTSNNDALTAIAGRNDCNTHLGVPTVLSRFRGSFARYVLAKD